MITRFVDRTEAGIQLAEKLTAYAGRPDVLVLALPRGGVPVAFEVSQALGVPLDVFIVRKLGVPGHEELAMGAIASGDVVCLNEEVIELVKPPLRAVQAVAVRELEELQRRERAYRDGRPPLEVRGRTVILVDDGLATGSTMKAAIAAVRRLNPDRIIVAVPAAAPSTAAEIERIADELVCVIKPDPFYAVGMCYDDFSQTTDDEVRELLRKAADDKVAEPVAV
jgi:predicted phosphoribosyltransferase